MEVDRLVITDHEAQRDVALDGPAEVLDGVDRITRSVPIKLDVAELRSIDSIDDQFEHGTPVMSACRRILHLVWTHGGGNVQELLRLEQHRRLRGKFRVGSSRRIERPAEENDGRGSSHVLPVSPWGC